MKLLFDGHPWPKGLDPKEMRWDTAWWDEGPSPAGNEGPYLHIDRPATQTTHRIYFEGWE